MFKDKEAGLVVDYLGLAEQLRQAVDAYGGKKGDKPGIPVEIALAVLQEKHEIVKAMFHGYDYSGYFTTNATTRVQALAGGGNHICKTPDGKKRFLDAMAALNKAVGIAIHLEGARFLRDDIAHDLVKAIRESVTIDWTQKESVRASMRTRVKRLLRKQGYPPDKREEAVVTVLEQAEVRCREWGEAA